MVAEVIDDVQDTDDVQTETKTDFKIKPVKKVNTSPVENVIETTEAVGVNEEVTNDKAGEDVVAEENESAENVDNKETGTESSDAVDESPVEGLPEAHIEEDVVDPVVDRVVETEVETVVEPKKDVVEPEVEPVIEPEEAVVEPEVETVVEPKAGAVVEPTKEVVVEPVVQEVVETANRPAEVTPISNSEPVQASKKVNPVSKRFGGSQEKCIVCTKTVYAMEKITADEKIFHKACLRCAHCSKILSLGNYAGLEGTNYCKPHFKALFSLKGNYDEGFGKDSYKKKWAK
eukprot:CFRG2101T1